MTPGLDRQTALVLFGTGTILAAASGFCLGCAVSGPPPRPISTPSPAASVESPEVEPAPTITGFQLLGEAFLPPEKTPKDAPLGGLSSITYDADLDLYYAISDDPASEGPARFYTLDIDLSSGSLDSSDVEVVARTELLDKGGSPFDEMTLDLEGIVLTPERTLYISSEGQALQGVDPFLREYQLDGSYVRDLPLPKKFLPRTVTGIRHNLGFESVALDARRNLFYTATENALLQDGPQADVGITSPCRILSFDRAGGRPVAEYVYMVDPLSQAPTDTNSFRARGLVELISLGSSRLLSLERAYIEGVGNAIEIFSVSLDGATDVHHRKTLRGKSFRPATKTRLVRLETFALELENLEGMTFGPRLADGRKSLVLIADNNFSSSQRNQILAFALEERTQTPSRIQGSGHRSPLEGRWIRRVRGTVTSLAARGPGFWLQGQDDQNEATSDALFVVPAGPVTVVPGNVVSVDGVIRETGRSGNLPLTTLADAVVEVIEEAAPLPDPVFLGAGGRALPSDHVDDDGLTIFDPAADEIDFLESLEGMRVAISDAVVVGPTTRFGGFAVTGDQVRGGVIRSSAGGLVTTDRDVNPQPLLVSAQPGVKVPDVAVGDRFKGPIRGVLDYTFGAFRVLAEALSGTVPRPRTHARASLTASDDAVLVATYNLENLSARSAEDKFQRLASSISQSLRSPDILAVQEVQDDSGPQDDGTVSAERTLTLLIEAISAAGGAEYRYATVNPEDHADGGQPGANIRVAYLYRPDRVRFVARGRPQASSSAEWLFDEAGAFLSPNPARVAPNHPAFSADPDRNLSGVRKPLAAEFEFNGRRLFLINVHLRSKRGDTPLFGTIQPPVRRSEPLRTAESRVIRDFVGDLMQFDPRAAAIVLGDFNESPAREPVRLLAESGLDNLVERIPESQRYTFVFRGGSGILDNVLVSESLAAGASVEIVHLNTDLPYSDRAADHDPILARFELP